MIPKGLQIWGGEDSNVQTFESSAPSETKSERRYKWKE